MSRLSLLFALPMLAAACAALDIEKSPPYVGSNIDDLSDPWRTGCSRFLGVCTLFNRDLNHQIFTVTPLTKNDDSPEPHILRIELKLTAQVLPHSVGMTVEYASTRLTAFKTDGCWPNTPFSRNNPCLQFYFRIPDRYPKQPFLVSIDWLADKTNPAKRGIQVPALTYRFAIDTAPPIGSMVDAARQGDVVEVKRLIALGVSMYDVKMFGRDARVDRTPMLIAVALGKVEVVKALLDAGYDVNWQPKEINSSLLIEAVRNDGLVEIVRLLLEAGARTDALYWHNGVSYTALGFAMRHPDTATLIPLLVAHGADINRVSTFGSALWSARSADLPESLVLVLEQNGGKMLPPDLECPLTSALRRTNSAEGFEQWCELKGPERSVRHGRYIRYGLNAKPRIVARYESGILAMHETFRPDGSFLLTEYYYPDGKVRARWHYRENGSPLRQDVYDAAGELVRSLFYESGYDVSRTVHYKDGKEVLKAR